jgi:diaminopimelate decarboxylase
MSSFTYKGGVLHAEAIALPQLAEVIGTPFYCYSTAALVTAWQSFANAFKNQKARIFYAANANLAVLSTLVRLGAGMDVVSEGEMQRALASGTPSNSIIFSGVGKTYNELVSALTIGIYQINVESIPELNLLSKVALDIGVRAPVAIRINPNVDACTHAKITTGQEQNKFGIDYRDAVTAFSLAKQLPGIDIVGVAVHIGSQVTDLAPYETAYRRIASLVCELRANGLRIDRFDLGGGLGIRYQDETPPTPSEYAVMVQRILGSLNCTLLLEPGRAVAGNAGILVARILYVKTGYARNSQQGRTFIIVDAAMNDFIRPALYDAWHEIMPVHQPISNVPYNPCDVVGPVCETGDTFALQRLLPPLANGELVAFGNAGAYGAVMSSMYNTRPLCPEVLVRSSAHAVVRRRPSFTEMVAGEILPSWIRAKEY